MGPLTLAWLAEHPARAAVPEAAVPAAPSEIVWVPSTTVTAARLAQKAQALCAREYDLLLWQANSTERVELARNLHAEADKIDRILKAFPAEAAATLKEIRRPPDLGLLEAIAAVQSPVPRLTEAIAAAMREFLELRGDQHVRVDKELAGQAARWDHFPPRLLPAKPPLPEFRRPATAVEADHRAADTRAATQRIRNRGRAGELLASWPARQAVATLRIAWWQEASEIFAASYAAEILAAAKILDADGRHAFWVFTHTLMASAFFAAFSEPAWRELIRRPVTFGDRRGLGLFRRGRAGSLSGEAGSDGLLQ